MYIYIYIYIYIILQTSSARLLAPGTTLPRHPTAQLDTCSTPAIHASYLSATCSPYILTLFCFQTLYKPIFAHQLRH